MFNSYNEKHIFKWNLNNTAISNDGNLTALSANNG